MKEDWFHRAKTGLSCNKPIDTILVVHGMSQIGSNFFSPFPYRSLWHTGLGTLGMGGGGAVGGSIHSQVLLKIGFLTNSLLFVNTMVCCYN